MFAIALGGVDESSALMNEKFRFNMSDLAARARLGMATSAKIDPSKSEDYASHLIRSPHAEELLKKAGWEDKEKKGVLAKGHRRWQKNGISFLPSVRA